MHCLPSSAAQGRHALSPSVRSMPYSVVTVYRVVTCPGSSRPDVMPDNSFGAYDPFLMSSMVLWVVRDVMSPG